MDIFCKWTAKGVIVRFTTNATDNNNNYYLLSSFKFFTKTLSHNYLQHKNIDKNNSNQVVKKGSKM